MKISYYNNIKDTKSREVYDIEDFVLAISHKSEWKQAVTEYREGKRDKTSLPAVTVSGLFNERKMAGLISHSGFIAFDFDEQDASALASDPYTFALFRSCSGRGFCCIVKIDPKKHKQSWSELANYYRDNFKLLVDQSCKDISRARFISFDPQMKINLESKTYKAKAKAKPTPKPDTSVTHHESDFHFALEQIQNQGIDITADYDEWIRAGLAIRSEFGDAGEDYWHIISQNHPDYDHKTASRKWRSFKGASRITIATFYHIAKSHGVNITSPRTQQIRQTSQVVKKNGGGKEELEKELKKQGVTPTPADLKILDEPYTPPENLENPIAKTRHFLNTNHQFWKCNVRDKFFDNEEEVNDEFVNGIWEDLQNLDVKVSKTSVQDMILSAKTEVRDPLRDLFPKIEHPGTNLIEELIDCIPYRYEQEAKTLFRYWFMGVMETLYEMPTPYCLVLTGTEGNTGKTQFIRRMIPECLKIWFGETNLDKGLDDDRVMTTKLVVFNDEFDGQTVTKSTRFKSLLSKDIFTMRVPYARHSKDYKRIASLVGTSNNQEIIFDKSTNNRRILPIEVKSRIDWERAGKIDKEKLWGQVYHTWKTKQWPAHMTPEVIDMLHKLSTNYEDEQFVDLFVREYIVEDPEEFMTNTQIIMEIKDHFKKEINPRELGMALRACGFDKVTRAKRKGYNVRIKNPLAKDSPAPF